MNQAAVRPMVVVVNAPRSLLKEQKAELAEYVQTKLPDGSSVIVLDPGFSLAIVDGNASMPRVVVDGLPVGDRYACTRVRP